jgi:hypothetical protein
MRIRQPTRYVELDIGARKSGETLEVRNHILRGQDRRVILNSRPWKNVKRLLWRSTLKPPQQSSPYGLDTVLGNSMLCQDAADVVIGRNFVVMHG